MHSAGSNGKSRGRLSSGGWTPTVLHNFTGGLKMASTQMALVRPQSKHPGINYSVQNDEFQKCGISPCTLSLLCSLCSPAAEATDWPQFGFNNDNTRYSPLETTIGVSNVSKLKLLQKVQLSGAIGSSAAFVSGVAYVGSNGVGSGGYIYAINSKGVLWQFQTGNAVTPRRRSPPALSTSVLTTTTSMP